MAWALHGPHERGLHRLDRVSRSETQVYVRPVGAVEVGLLATLIGAWGAICVYIGPYFGYRPTSHGTWDWTTQNLAPAPPARGRRGGGRLDDPGCSRASPP